MLCDAGWLHFVYKLTDLLLAVRVTAALQAHPTWMQSPRQCNMRYVPVEQYVHNVQS